MFCSAPHPDLLKNSPNLLCSEEQAVAQLVEALRYKPEGRGFDSWSCHCNFSLPQSFRTIYGPGVDLSSNRNEYQEYFLGGNGGRCVRLTTLPHPCAVCLEIWEPQLRGTLGAWPGLYGDCFTFFLPVTTITMFLSSLLSTEMNCDSFFILPIN